jgi:hypothetical protein
MTLRLVNPSRNIDKYPDTFMFTPTDWITKINSVSPEDRINQLRIGRAFKYNDSFHYDKNVEESCDNIQNLKKKYCKGLSISCTESNSLEDMKKNHDSLMMCRNIRSLENNSECIYDNKQINKHHEQHSEQVINFSNGAFKCVSMYNKKSQRRYRAFIKKHKKYKRSYERKSSK